MDQVLVQPLAVGLPGSIGLLQFIIAEDTSLLQVHQQHPARLQPGFLDDLLRGQVQHTHLGGEDEPFVPGDIVPGGPQAVAVQHRPHPVAVGEEDGGRTVPGLHEGGVVLVEVPLGPGDGGVVLPGLGDTGHDGQRQVHAGHHEELQGVVQHGRVGARHLHHRQYLGQVAGEEGGGHGLLPGQHPVHIAPDGVDLAVVSDETVGVGPLPGGVGVGGETGMDDGQSGLVVRVLEVGVELPQLPDQEHALIDDGAAGEGGDIGALGGVLEEPPDHIEPPVEVRTGGGLRRTGQEGLLDHGHLVQGSPAEDLGADRHLPPAQEGEALLGGDVLKQLPGLAPPLVVLGEEKHAHTVVSGARQGDAGLFGGLGEEGVRDLDQDAHAVAGLSPGVLAGPVLQLLHDLQGVVHCPVAGSSLNVHHGADAAGVVLKVRPVKALTVLSFHMVHPLSMGGIKSGAAQKRRQPHPRTAASRLRCL